MQERVAKIEAHKLSFADFLSSLDYDMLKLFVKSMLAYLFASVILSLIFLVCVYFFNEDLWYEYFPVSDDEQVIVNLKALEEL